MRQIRSYVGHRRAFPYASYDGTIQHSTVERSRKVQVFTVKRGLNLADLKFCGIWWHSQLCPLSREANALPIIFNLKIVRISFEKQTNKTFGIQSVQPITNFV